MPKQPKPIVWVNSQGVIERMTDPEIPRRCFYRDEKLCCIRQVGPHGAHHGYLWACSMHEQALQAVANKATDVVLREAEIERKAKHRERARRNRKRR